MVAGTSTSSDLPFREIHRPYSGLPQALGVAQGLAWLLLVALVCMNVGGRIFGGVGWVPVIAWESVWLISAIIASTLLPNGVRHDISWQSTIEGIKLDWPELAYTVGVFASYMALPGGLTFTLAPIIFALSVGIAEEFFFRVVILGWLITRVSTPAALTISACVFGLAHLHEFSINGLLSVAPQTAGGFILGAIYLRTRNPLGPIICHALWDIPYFLALGVGVSGGQVDAGGPTVISLVPWIVCAIYGLWLVRHGVDTAGRTRALGITPARESGNA